MANNKFEARLGLDTKEFDKKLKDSNAKTKDFGDKGKSSMMSFAGALAVVSGAFALLLNNIKQTATGIDKINVMTAVTKQLMYDVLHRTPWGDVAKNIKEVTKAQGISNFMRRKERDLMYESKTIYANYQKFLVDAHDQTLSNTQRVQNYDWALKALNMSLDKQSDALAGSLGAIQKMLKASPDNEAFLIEEARLKEALIDIESRRFSGMKEISSMRSGLIKSEAEDLRKLAEAFNTVTKAETSMLNALPVNEKSKSVFKPDSYGLAPKLSNKLAGAPPQYAGSQMVADAMAQDWQNYLDEFGIGFEDIQSSLIDLSDTFAGFFSDVNLGFQGMIDGVITGIKRLVMELMAKAVFLAILSAIGGPAGKGVFTLGNIVGGNIGKILNDNAGAKTASAGFASDGVMQDQLMASLNGKQIDIIMKRYNG